MMPLVLKDFTIVKNNIKTTLLLAVVLGIIFTTTGNPFITVTLLPSLLTYSFINRMLYDDEKNNTLRFLATLPIKKEYMVYARYITLGIMFLVIIVLQWVLGFIFMYFGAIDPLSPGMNGWDSLFYQFSMTLVPIALFFAIYLPVAFYFGYIKAANSMKFLFIGYFLLFTGAATYLSSLPPDSTIGRLVSELNHFLTRSSSFVIFLTSVAFSAILLLLSMRVSAAIFKRRRLF